MPHPPEPSGLIQVVAYQILTWLRDIAGSVRIALFQLAMCLFLFFTYAVPDQANDIFVALSNGENFQLTGLIFSLLLISYINWYMVRYIFVKLLLYNRLPDHYSENFYRNWIEPFVTLFPFAAAALGFYYSVHTLQSWFGILLVAGAGITWYIILVTLIRRGISPSLKKIMRSEEPVLPGLNWYRIIVVVFLLFFASLVLLPQHLGWAQMFGPIVTISLGFCFWTWLGSHIYLFSRLWFTPFIPIALTYVLFVASHFNNNHAVRTLPLTLRSSVYNQVEVWLKNKFQETKSDSLSNVNVYIVSAEGGGIRSAYWTSGVLAWLEEETHFALHKNIIAMSGVSGGSVGLGFFTSGMNVLLESPDSLTRLKIKLRKTTSADFLSDLNSGLIFNDVIQKAIPYPIGYFDRARKLEDAFGLAFANNFYGKQNFDWGICEQYTNGELPFNPVLMFNTTHVESGRKAIISSCRMDDVFFHDVIDVIDTLDRDIPLKCAVSMSARFPFVTPPALVTKKGHTDWGHVVDGGYFDNSGLQTAWQMYLLIQRYIERMNSEGISTPFQQFLARVKIKVIYIKNSYTGTEEQSQPLTIEELAPGYAFVNAWGRKSVTEINHFKNALSDSCFYFIPLKRGLDDGIPLGWYLSKEACIKMKNQLDTLRRMKSAQQILADFKCLY